MIKLILKIDNFLENLKAFDFIGLFFLRAYLFFIFWNAGVRKIAWDDGIPNVDRFSDFLGPGGEDNLNLILPNLFAWLTVIAEAGGAILLLIGLFSKWAAVPILVCMIVATYYHSPNGWNADAGGYEMSVTYFLITSIILLFGPGKYLSLDFWVQRK
mgnify:FL=1